MSGKVVHVLGPHEFDLYVGRAVPRKKLQQSEFANPWVIGKDGTREEVLARYEEALRQTWEKHDFYAAELIELHGKTLACWCAPKDGFLTTEDETVCHAQIILRLADELAEDRKWEAFCRESDVRCVYCNLRYGERKQYGCIGDRAAHHYDEAELVAARNLEEV